MVRWEDWRNCWSAVRRISISRRERDVRMFEEGVGCAGVDGWWAIWVVVGVLVAGDEEVEWSLRRERLDVKSASVDVRRG